MSARDADAPAGRWLRARRSRRLPGAARAAAGIAIGGWSWAQVQRAATLAHVAIARVVEIKRRRTYAGEELWFPLLEEHGLVKLRRAFISAGVTPQVAAGLVFFLVDQLELDRQQTESTRNRYRRILAELDPAEVARAARAIPG